MLKNVRLFREKQKRNETPRFLDERQRPTCNQFKQLPVTRIHFPKAPHPPPPHPPPPPPPPPGALPLTLLNRSRVSCIQKAAQHCPRAIRGGFISMALILMSGIILQHDEETRRTSLLHFFFFGKGCVRSFQRFSSSTSSLSYMA